MPSQLVKNDNVEFICARDFVWDGVEYHIGETFDQDIAIGRIELLVRTRRVIPVVESTDVKPRHWHREVRLKSLVLERLGVSDLKAPKVPQFSRMAVEPEEAPVEEIESTPDADVEVVRECNDEGFTPEDHTIDEVMAYVGNDPDKATAVYEQEEQGKNRSTLLAKLGEVINQEESDV